MSRKLVKVFHRIEAYYHNEQGNMVTVGFATFIDMKRLQRLGKKASGNKSKKAKVGPIVVEVVDCKTTEVK